MSAVKSSFSDLFNQLFNAPKAKPLTENFKPETKVAVLPVETPKPKEPEPQVVKEQTPIMQKVAVTSTAKAPEISNQAIQLKKVAKDLQTIRKTAAFIKNAPRLFQSSSSALMTAKLATQILRDCGVDIPREVELSIAACQVIASGGAAVQAGSATGASFGSVAEPTAAAVQAAIALFQETGMTNLNSLQVQQANLLLDVVMVVASMGSNVVADIKLCYDMYMAAENSKLFAQFDADNQVRMRLSEFRTSRLKMQAEAASQNFERLMRGDIGMFGFATQIARNSAETFPRLFPEIATFFPPTAIDVLDVEYHSQDSSFFNIPAGWASASGHTEVVMSRSRNQMEMLSKWCELFLDPCIEGYNRVLAEDDGANINKLSLTSLCIMAMLPPYFKDIPEDFDPRPYLVAWNLTPYDFYNDDCVTEEFYKTDSKFIVSDFEKQIQSPITFNGVEYISPQLRSKRELLALRKKMKPGIIEANRNGDIQYLLKDPDTNALIKEWGRIVDHGTSDFYTTIERVPGKFELQKVVHRIKGSYKQREPIYPNSEKSLLKNQLNLRNSLLNGGWRNIQNYFSVLSMIETLSGDWKGYSPSVDKENKLRGSAKSLEEECSKMYAELNAMRVSRQPQLDEFKRLAMTATDPSSALRQIDNISSELNEFANRYQARENLLIEAREELQSFIDDAPKREAYDKAFAADFKKTVWEKYPQVVATQEQINDKYREVSGKMIYRQMNKMAFSNIAKLLNVPVNKLVQVNKGDLKPDGPGIFKGI